MFRLLPLLLLVPGCVRYEHDVVQPAGLAGPVGTESWVSFRRDELEYRLRTADDRLVMRIYNRGERPVKLLGADSVAVDPRGEGHPLQSATILPGSHVSRIFPPPRPQVAGYGPSFGFGTGVGYGYGGPVHDRDHFGYGYGAYDDVGPRYYSVYDPNDRTHFNWPGNTDLRMLLAYQRGLAGQNEPGGTDGTEPTFRHEFVFRRRKI